jgi:formylglycine-generating enzyme required for sulfatase activity
VFPWGSDWRPPAGAGNYAGQELKLSLASGKYKFLTSVSPFYQDEFTETSPVGSFKPNQYGIFDLSGDVFEWCKDLFDPDKSTYVARGGAWSSSTNSNSELLLSCRRQQFSKVAQISYLGFRCVLAPIAK